MGPLFSDEIEAWPHEPVVPPVYRAYRHFAASTIRLPESDPFTWDEVDPAAADLLGRVWNTYGGYSAGRLRAMTHEERPWQATLRDRRARLPDPGPGPPGVLCGPLATSAREPAIHSHFGRFIGIVGIDAFVMTTSGLGRGFRGARSTPVDTP